MPKKVDITMKIYLECNTILCGTVSSSSSCTKNGRSYMWVERLLSDVQVIISWQKREIHQGFMDFKEKQINLWNEICMGTDVGVFPKRYTEITNLWPHL